MASKLLPDASWTARTATPGRIAPLESVTVPLKTASCAQPATGTAIIMQKTINRLTTGHRMGNLRVTEVEGHRRSDEDPIPLTTDHERKRGTGASRRANSITTVGYRHVRLCSGSRGRDSVVVAGLLRM